MVDEIDMKILEILKENSRTTYVDIGKALGLSEGTVRNRIQSLTDSGVIKRFTVEISLGVGVRALIMISVDPQMPTLEISDKVLKLPGVEKIYEVTGEYDVVTVVSSSSIEGLNQTIEEIRVIDGIVKTNTVIVLRTV
ncbi:winged helix-turn-helix transcriptional regulator [archaeon]|nr:winged helix-turn-helix transcriptional regulator [archaeon]